MFFYNLIKTFFFIKYTAGRITYDELNTHLLDLQKTLIITKGRVSSDVFLP